MNIWIEENTRNCRENQLNACRSLLLDISASPYLAYVPYVSVMDLAYWRLETIVVFRVSPLLYTSFVLDVLHLSLSRELIGKACDATGETC